MLTALEETLAQFGILSLQQIEKVLSYASKRSYRKGDFFLQAGKANLELGYLLSGVFRYYIIDRNGNEITSVFVTEGDFFTELDSFHNEQISQGYFQAETDAEILAFSRSDYKLMVNEIKEMEYIFKRLSQKKLLAQVRLLRKILTLEAKDSYLLMLELHPYLVSRVPDQHLASFLGITKYSLSRIKKKIMDGNK